MTLNPVLLDARGEALLLERGLLAVLRSSLETQVAAAGRVQADLVHVVGPGVRGARRPWFPTGPMDTGQAVGWAQRLFFPTLFLRVFEAVGATPARLRFYAELDFCVLGTIAAADNLLDDQDRSLLPIDPGPGQRFRALLELMCFERLTRRVVGRGVDGGLLDAAQGAEIERRLLDQMAAIGALEGSEEGGVAKIPPPMEMLQRVHRVRGGALFALAAVAPAMLEPKTDILALAQRGLVSLGTAFQVVDDLVDFEEDVALGSHNLLVAQVHHLGAPAERARMAALRGHRPGPQVAEVEFGHHAAAVLDHACVLARSALTDLARVGLPIRAELAEELVLSVAGPSGGERLSVLAAK